VRDGAARVGVPTTGVSYVLYDDPVGAGGL
jgi:hypothetical protein